eukprot:m.592064 g.592064  ORF g.592064 m.592064 type:complete len:106 (+) comp58021_c0_seq1:4639-4956(+)
MFFAAIAHIYAFPYKGYTGDAATSIASNLKATLNPSDLIGETIRNFSPQYETYVKPATDEDDVHVPIPDDDPHEGTVMAITSFAELYAVVLWLQLPQQDLCLGTN